MRTDLAIAPFCMSWLIALIGTDIYLLAPSMAQSPNKPYKVSICEDNARAVQNFLPVDPRVRISYNHDSAANMNFNVNVDGKRYSLNVSTMFMIDDNIQAPIGAPPFRYLPFDGTKNKQHGGRTMWRQGDIRVTMTMEVVPGQPPQPKPGAPIPRCMDTLLVKYLIENIGNGPHKVACRVLMDVYIINNDGALFASPTTHPGEILNGIALEGKQLPPFFEVLQNADLQEPGEKGIFTLKLGHKLEGPSKIVLTNLGAANSDWDAPPQPAGDSACVLLWQPQEIPAKGKRELAYAYGQGLAAMSETRLSAHFSGPFAPATRFTITAYVDDPVEGQTLALLLPKGIKRIDGQAVQMVPLPTDNSTTSVVMWRCQLLEEGAHAVGILSSTGITRNWTIKISPPDE